MASPPVVGFAKRIKLDFEGKKYGAAPNLEAKFRDLGSFITTYRAYQWTQGYDTEVSHRDAIRATLTCLTHRSTCTFSITCKKTMFEEGVLMGQIGYIILPSPFQPVHNHSPTFHPLDLEAENQRRMRLAANDPSLDFPPGLTPLTQSNAPPTLAAFLASIHPSLATERVLSILDANDLPVETTSPADLLDLEDEVYSLFKEIPGLEPMLPALVVDGVRRAKARRDAGEDGFNGGFDPVEWKTLEDFVLGQIAAETRKQREESNGTPMTLG